MPRPPIDRSPSRSTRRGKGQGFAIRPAPASSPLTKTADVEAKATSAAVWQVDSYNYVDTIGEIGYALNLKAAVIGQCNLTAEAKVYNTDTGAYEWEDSNDPRVRRVLDSFKPPQGEQGELLGMAAMHLETAGEAFLYGEPALNELGQPTGLLWEFLSVLELEIGKDGTVKRNRSGKGSGGRNRGENDTPPNAYVARLHKRDLKYSAKADSPMRRVLPICVAEGELVFGPGGPTPIEKVQQGQIVYAYDDGRMVARPVSRVISNGTKPVVEIKTGRHTIKVTPDHRMLVMREDRVRKGRLKDPVATGVKLRAARLAAGYSQATFAAAMGVNNSCVSRWETGLQGIAWAQAAPMSKILGMSFTDDFSPRYSTEWVEAGHLQRGDRLVAARSTPDIARAPQLLPDGTEVTAEVAWFLGAMCGDGSIHDPYQVRLATFDRAFTETAVSIVEATWGLGLHGDPDGQIEWNSAALVSLLSQVGLSLHSPERVVPAAIWASTSKVQRAFLEGYAEADGHRLPVDACQAVRYAATSLLLLEQVRALHLMLGDPVSNLTCHREARIQEFKTATGRIYLSPAKKLWGFEVYAVEGRDGFRGRRPDWLSNHFNLETVRSVTDAGETPVWDLTVPGPANFVVSGLVAHNCKEVVLYTQVLEAIAKSRLSAGLLYIPWEFSFGADDEFEDPGEEAESFDEFETELKKHLNAPIEDRASESSLVPLLMRGPAILRNGEGTSYPAKDLMGLIQLSRELDSLYKELRAEALHRLAGGLDIPPEIIKGKSSLSGLGGGNVAEQIDEDFIARHIIPVGQRICSFITTAYLRPMLTVFEDVAPDQAEWFRVVLDTSPITTDTDLSAPATLGVELETISDEAWRQANNFTEDDAPTDEEQYRRMLEKLLMAQPTLGPAILPELYPALTTSAMLDQWDIGQATPNNGQDLLLQPPAAPSTKPPMLADTTRAFRVMILAAADRDLNRALERAGNRLMSRLNGIDKDKAVELRSLDPVMRVTHAGVEFMGAVGMTVEDLFTGCFDDLHVRVVEWLTVDMTNRGSSPFAARRKATVAADELVTQLTQHGGTALDRPITVGINGTTIPDEIVESALAAGDLVRS